MSFQDEVIKTRDSVLNLDMYKKPFKALEERANMKAMDLKFEKSQKQAEQEGLEI